MLSSYRGNAAATSPQASDQPILVQSSIPQYTTAQRDALTDAQAESIRLIYNTTTNKLNVYNGTAWEVVTSA